MKRLFIDTGAFVARALPSDSLHLSAVKTWASLATTGIELISTEHIFDETLTLLARRVGYPYAAQWGALHLQSSSIAWVSAAPSDLIAALALMKKYADQSISFTDCVSFQCMRKMRIKDVFGYDRHFRLAGFDIHP
jgi:uncharacterized protein